MRFIIGASPLLLAQSDQRLIDLFRVAGPEREIEDNTRLLKINEAIRKITKELEIFSVPQRQKRIFKYNLERLERVQENLIRDIERSMLQELKVYTSQPNISSPSLKS